MCEQQSCPAGWAGWAVWQPGACRAPCTTQGPQIKLKKENGNVCFFVRRALFLAQSLTVQKLSLELRMGILDNPRLTGAVGINQGGF